MSFISTRMTLISSLTVDLLVDTGSSNTWVGAGKALPITSTTKATGNLVVSILFIALFYPDTDNILHFYNASK